MRHIHIIPVTCKVISLFLPPNGCSQEKVVLCHEGNTVTLTMYVLLLGHSNDNELPQPLAQLPSATAQLTRPGKLNRTAICPDLNKHCKVTVWFTTTFVEGLIDNDASPENKY